MDDEPLSPETDPALAVLDRLDLIVWIESLEEIKLHWCNRAAINFMGAESMKALTSRKMHISDNMRAYIRETHRKLKTEHFVRTELTLHPDGKGPVRVAFVKSLYKLPSGRDAALVELTPIRVEDPETVRRLDAARDAPLVVTTYSIDGMLLSANTFARSMFGNDFNFVGMFLDRETGERHLARLALGETVTEDAEVITQSGRRWLALVARKIVDPVSLVPAILLCAHDVTERRAAERWKEELIGVVSHELRTPLTGIRGALDLLAAGLFPDMETRDELLDIAREDTLRLSRLVEDLLDVQRLGAGVLTLSRAVTCLTKVAERTLERHRQAADLAGVRLRLVGQERPFCDIDALRIGQVLGNLVSNAIKHSTSGDTVVVEIQCRGELARISVKDEGPGVPEAFRSRIFTAFAQADASDERPRGGTGLGLYLSKRLVEQHGGTMGYDPDTPRGALFYFELLTVPPASNGVGATHG